MSGNFFDGVDTENVSTEYESGGGDFPLIPHGTRVIACIDRIEWGTKKNFKVNVDEDCILLRFDIEQGEYKNLKILKNLFVKSNDQSERSKSLNLLLAIDKNAGGKILQLKRAPDDDDLSKYLIGKSMVIIVGVIKDKETGKERNYLAGVSANKESKSQEKRTETYKNGLREPGQDDDSGLDIPF